jgi:uncharacterized protein YqgC (DUF456 family)
MLAFSLAVLLIAVALVCWAVTWLGLPGNWLMVAAAAADAAFAPARVAIGWKAIAGLLALAVLGEAFELALGAVQASRAGGTRPAAALALLGSLAGGALGVIIGLPIPLVGPFLAALLMAGLGAMAGAILGELAAGRDLWQGLRVGRAAFVGRLLGTLSKVLVGAVMVGLIVVALLVRAL